MTEIRRADAAARRQAVVLVVLGTIVGALLIVGFERYYMSLRAWLMSEPGEIRHRVTLVFFVAAAVFSAPLIGFATFLWSLGTTVLQTREFPPPGHRVVRDTPILRGPDAVLRGRGLKGLALGLAAACALMCLLLWRLAGILVEHVV